MCFLWKSSPRLGVQKPELNLPLPMVLRALKNLKYSNLPQCRVVFSLFFFFFLALSIALCVSGQRDQVGFSELLDEPLGHPIIFWQISDPPPWQTLGCVAKMSLPLKTMQRSCCLVKKKEKGAV